MKLKEMRINGKLSQAQLAEKIKISQSNYSKYETGKFDMPLTTAINIANFYDVSLDYLCDRQYNNNVGFIPDDRKDGVKKLLNLNDIEFNNVLGYINAILDIKNK